VLGMAAWPSDLTCLQDKHQLSSPHEAVGQQACVTSLCVHGFQHIPPWSREAPVFQGGAPGSTVPTTPSGWTLRPFHGACPPWPIALMPLAVGSSSVRGITYLGGGRAGWHLTPPLTSLDSSPPAPCSFSF